MKAVPTHHPDGELLLARAAGGVSPAIALVLSAHIDTCQRCAGRARMLDMVGGTVLEETPPASLSENALERTLALLDEPVAPEPGTQGIIAETLRARGLDQVPRSLRALTAAAAESRTWKKRPGGVKEFFLRTEPDGTEMRYLLIPPGTGVPRHTHRGMEFTLVVTGAFHDETGRYGPGDLEVASGDLTHRPIAGKDEPCLAFAVTNAPLRFTGALGLVQRAFGA